MARDDSAAPPPPARKPRRAVAPLVVIGEGGHESKVFNRDGLEMLATIPSGSVDLVLTDPPYLLDDIGILEEVLEERPRKTWEEYCRNSKSDYDDEQSRRNYERYGCVIGSVNAHGTRRTWDANNPAFDMDRLSDFIAEFFRVLRPGGTLIIFFDFWKLSELRKLMTTRGRSNFHSIRIVEWLKTNPIPVNNRLNYLSNPREVALTGIKRGRKKAHAHTFNAHHHRGVFEYPIERKPWRFHPTMKSVRLIQELVCIHSNPGDTVLDAFVGNGTTLAACHATGRRFIGSEIDPIFFRKLRDLRSTPWHSSKQRAGTAAAGVTTSKQRTDGSKRSATKEAVP